MTDRSRVGAAGRRKGHDEERRLARWFTDHNVFGGTVITTRNRLKGAGRQAELGGDFCYEDGAALPWVIDAKTSPLTPANVDKWLDKLYQDAQGRRAVLIVKQPNKPIGLSWVVQRTAGTTHFMWLDEWAWAVRQRD